MYNKLSSSLAGKASVLALSLMMVTSVLFVAPSSAMAQQTTTATTATESTTTTGPLTPRERQEQNRLGNVTTAITHNLQQGEMQVNGIVYTPRWANPVWVQPNSLSVLFMYCLPGEFADSGQQILGSRDLDVLESYSVALSPVMTGWLMVVENEHQTERSPAAVGVICASDANDPESRNISQEDKTVIKNVIQQFITIRNIQRSNITQVINIINNITTNQTGGGGNNQTGNQTGGNQTGGGGGNQTNPLTVVASVDVNDGGEAPASFLLEAYAQGGVPFPGALGQSERRHFHWDFGDGTTGEGCCLDHFYETPGHFTATVTVTDYVGNTASDSVTIPVGTSSILRVGVIAEPMTDEIAPSTWSFRAAVYDPVSNNRTASDYTYDWSFGDGQTSDSAGSTVTHTYENPGSYEVTVTVTDPDGNTAGSNSDECCHLGIIARGGTENATTAATTEEEEQQQPSTTNETSAAIVTPPPPTGGEETTETPPPPPTGGEETTETPPPPPPTGGEETTETPPPPPPTGGEETTTTTETPPPPPPTIDTLGQ